MVVFLHVCFVYCASFALKIHPPGTLVCRASFLPHSQHILDVFHDSTRLIFFSQHMDGTITPYNIFSRQPGYFADLHSTQYHPTTPHLPLLSHPPNQLPVITKEEAVHPLVIHPPKCRFYSNSIFSLHFTLKLTPRWQDLQS